MVRQFVCDFGPAKIKPTNPGIPNEGNQRFVRNIWAISKTNRTNTRMHSQHRSAIVSQSVCLVSWIENAEADQFFQLHNFLHIPVQRFRAKSDMPNSISPIDKERRACTPQFPNNCCIVPVKTGIPWSSNSFSPKHSSPSGITVAITESRQTN